MPWNIHRPVKLRLGEEERIDLHTTGKGMQFFYKGARWEWRCEQGEWVLLKEHRETGRYVVAVFLPRGRGWKGWRRGGKAGGVLLVDERGCERGVGVGTCAVLERGRGWRGARWGSTI